MKPERMPDLYFRALPDVKARLEGGDYLKEKEAALA
jgi:hypothetical protein